MNDELTVTWCTWRADRRHCMYKELGLASKRELTLPGGFLVERYSVDVIGLCAKCQ